MPPTVFDLCRPRPDVLSGQLEDARLAADLAQVLAGTAPPVYADPARFFANTYPTRGLRDLLRHVLAVLSGSGGEAGTVFRLHTHFGGGKTHALIALVHAARGAPEATEIAVAAHRRGRLSTTRDLTDYAAPRVALVKP
ncbi:MAG: hypothetical protein RMK73_14250 [Geminicoccaceae bacterium]|nr:hypothetical protein [Geminicoccaceae bacterium]